MASPRSMWSGTISLGLLTVPVTIGKSWADERENSLRDLCSLHGVPVDRTERCPTGPKCTLAGGKQKGVQHRERQWRKLNENEYAKIEDATKSDTLEVLDVQPAYDTPLSYGTGTYYVRYDAKAKGHTPDAFANFVAALGKGDKAAIVKWCKSARQKLAILHTRGDGILLLTTVPFESELREPGKMEKAHSEVEVQDAVVEQFTALFDAVASESFDHAAYSDEGLRLRSEAVEKILGGEKLQDKDGEQKQEGGQKTPDLMQQLMESIEEKKISKKEKA